MRRMSSAANCNGRFLHFFGTQVTKRISLFPARGGAPTWGVRPFDSPRVNICMPCCYAAVAPSSCEHLGNVRRSAAFIHAVHKLTCLSAQEENTNYETSLCTTMYYGTLSAGLRHARLVTAVPLAMRNTRRQIAHTAQAGEKVASRYSRPSKLENIAQRGLPRSPAGVTTDSPISEGQPSMPASAHLSLRRVGLSGNPRFSPLQQAAFPTLSEGRSLFLLAPTGAGKTLAYMLPLLHRLRREIFDTAAAPHTGIRLLILVPTKELAAQILQIIRRVSNSSSHALVGGYSYAKETEALCRGVDIAVATPARLMLHMRNGNVTLRYLSAVVIEEAATMCDREFEVDLAKLLLVLVQDRGISIDRLHRKTTGQSDDSGSKDCLGSSHTNGAEHEPPGPSRCAVQIIFVSATHTTGISDFLARYGRLLDSLNPTHSPQVAASSPTKGSNAISEASIERSTLNGPSSGKRDESRLPPIADLDAAQPPIISSSSSTVTKNDGACLESAESFQRTRHKATAVRPEVQIESNGTPTKPPPFSFSPISQCSSITRLSFTGTHSPPGCMEQVFVPLRGHGRMGQLIEVLDERVAEQHGAQSIIFCSSIAACRAIEWTLKERGHSVSCLHSSMPPMLRKRSAADFRRNVTNILVATDVASRGLDIPSVRHVVLYDFPESLTEYLTRAGRTARAGQPGRVTSLVSKRDLPMVRQVQEATQTMQVPAKPTRSDQRLTKRMKLEEKWQAILARKNMKHRIGGRKKLSLAPRRYLTSQANIRQLKQMHFRYPCDVICGTCLRGGGDYRTFGEVSRQWYFIQRG
eukprot:GHVT01091755.1.p1 GENE.GHVT01091755.1~~GHVT01091755.1.p1  ORF type:complete len:808 (+),score=22.47 GHVT01091755.1:2289-4712(+)